jgi:cupin 2 domain-containing protein
VTRNLVIRGRLRSAAGAPAEGERVERLVKRPGLTVEQILSGRFTEPVSFDQDHDEWVLVVEGRAKLVVEGSKLELEAGDWVLLHAGYPHTLVETRPGTSWLAVHLALTG